MGCIPNAACASGQPYAAVAAVYCAKAPAVLSSPTFITSATEPAVVAEHATEGSTATPISTPSQRHAADCTTRLHVECLGEQRLPWP